MQVTLADCESDQEKLEVLVDVVKNSKRYHDLLLDVLVTDSEGGISTTSGYTNELDPRRVWANKLVDRGWLIVVNGKWKSPCPALLNDAFVA